MIKFDFNWNNKLYNNIYTTIRKKPYVIGEIHLISILYNNEYCIHSNAKVIDCFPIRLGILSKNILMLDTGMEYDDAIDLLKKYKIKIDEVCYLITLQKHDSFYEVIIRYNNETGKNLYSIAKIDDEENWIASFTKLENALSFIHDKNYIIKKFRNEVSQ